MRSTSIEYIMKDNRSKCHQARNRRPGDCFIHVAKCEVVPKAIPMATQKSFSRTVIQNDSQLVVNAIKGKIGVPKDIMNLVEDIKYLLTHFIECKVEYYNINSDPDILAEKTHL